MLWEPLGADDAGPVVPLPGRLAVRPAVGVVGREAELTVDVGCVQAGRRG